MAVVGCTLRSFAPNQVISGWTEAMLLMVEGDKWELYLPAELAYGDRGAGRIIGPGDCLVFTIEMLRILGGRTQVSRPPHPPAPPGSPLSPPSLPSPPSPPVKPSLEVALPAGLNPALTLAFTLAAALLVVVPGPTVLMVVGYGLRVGRRAVCASTLGVLCGDATSLTLCLGGLGGVHTMSPVVYNAIRAAGVVYLLYLAWCTWREGHTLPPDSNASEVAPAASTSTELPTALELEGSLEGTGHRATSVEGGSNQTSSHGQGGGGACGLEPGADEADTAPLSTARPAAASARMHRGVSSARIFRSTYAVTALNPKGWTFFLAFVPQFVDRQRAYWPQVAAYAAIFLSAATMTGFVYASTAGRLADFLGQPRHLQRLKLAAAAFLVAAALLSTIDAISSMLS